MTTSPLVSIIIPCYNGDKYIHRCIDSIINQTYDNMELIFVNDGSSDKTEEVILSYKNKFDELNIRLIYLFQINAGQASALNNGLKYISGKYLTWFDIDDWLSDNCIKTKVEYLENNNTNFVRSNGLFYNENNLNKPIKEIAESNDKLNKNIYIDLIINKTFCCNGCYMVRTSEFLRIFPDKEIFISRAGQNNQLLIPISYNNECGFIDKCLFNIVVRKDSHSRIKKNFKDEIDRNNMLRDIKIWCVNKIGDNDRINIIKSYYYNKNLKLYYYINDKISFITAYNFMKTYNIPTFTEKIMNITIRYSITHFIALSLLNIAKHILNKFQRSSI